MRAPLGASWAGQLLRRYRTCICVELYRTSICVAQQTPCFCIVPPGAHSNRCHMPQSIRLMPGVTPAHEDTKS